MRMRDIKVGGIYAVRLDDKRIVPMKVTSVGPVVDSNHRLTGQTAVEGVVDQCGVEPFQRVTTRAVVRSWADQQALMAERPSVPACEPDLGEGWGNPTDDHAPRVPRYSILEMARLDEDELYEVVLHGEPDQQSYAQGLLEELLTERYNQPDA